MQKSNGTRDCTELPFNQSRISIINICGNIQFIKNQHNQSAYMGWSLPRVYMLNKWERPQRIEQWTCQKSSCFYIRGWKRSRFKSELNWVKRKWELLGNQPAENFDLSESSISTKVKLDHKLQFSVFATILFNILYIFYIYIYIFYIIFPSRWEKMKHFGCSVRAQTFLYPFLKNYILIIWVSAFKPPQKIKTSFFPPKIAFWQSGCEEIPSSTFLLLVANLQTLLPLPPYNSGHEWQSLELQNIFYYSVRRKGRPYNRLAQILLLARHLCFYSI